MSQLEPCPYVRYGVEHWLSIPCSSEGEYTVASSNVGAYSLVKNSLFVTGYQALFGEPKLLPAGIAGGMLYERTAKYFQTVHGSAQLTD